MGGNIHFKLRLSLSTIAVIWSRFCGVRDHKAKYEQQALSFAGNKDSTDWSLYPTGFLRNSATL